MKPMNTDCDAKPRTPKPRERRRRFQTEADCVKQMEIYRKRPDMLAAALLVMGITETGDESAEEN